MEEPFVEQAKRALLYEHTQGSDFHEMLEESDTNTRTNQNTRQLAILIGQTERAWTGPYQYLLTDLVHQVHRLWLNDDAYARQQAIAIVKGRAGLLGTQDNNKKSGILGIFGK